MSARFQVVSVPRRRDDGPVDGERAGSAPTSRRRFTWRFLAANNRALAMADAWYPDAASCIASIHELKRGLKSADCEFLRDAKGLWTWRVRADSTVASSTHRYPRQLRARMTCESFFALADDPAAVANVSVVYRS